MDETVVEVVSLKERVAANEKNMDGIKNIVREVVKEDMVRDIVREEIRGAPTTTK